MLKMEVKHWFFDAPKVRRAVNAARRKVLVKIGKFIRVRARSLIRSRKGPSSPGQPPHSHSGQLKQFLFYSWDAASDGVVIGPEKLGKRSVPAPHVLEFGGHATRYKKPVRIRPRPFMSTALNREIEAGTLPRFWKDSVRVSGG